MLNEKRSKVLIVDDVAENIHIMMNVLKEDFDILAATNGKKALDIVNKNLDMDIILLDIMMPEMDGYEVCRVLKSSDETKNIPVIFITALSSSEDEEEGLCIGAVDYITKPINPSIVKQRVKNHIELKHYRDHLELLVKERTRELTESKEAIIEAMGIVAEMRDNETGEHIHRVKEYVRLIAKQLINDKRYADILTKEYVENLYHSAPLHDIGKVAVPDNILLKKSKLNNEEFKDMQLHTVKGEAALDMVQKYTKQNKMIHTAKEMASAHHENWDGSGYPNGLKGEDIPLSARIMSIADVYDAMVNKRVYKEPIDKKEVLQFIKDNSSIKFDPAIVDAFLKVIDKFDDIK